MLAVLLRLMAEVGPQIIWVFIFIAAVVVVFVIYVGIALRATLRAEDAEEREVCHQVLRDLLDLFRHGSRK